MIKFQEQHGWNKAEINDRMDYLLTPSINDNNQINWIGRRVQTFCYRAFIDEMVLC